MLELWQSLVSDNLYSKPFEEFQKQFSTPEAQDKLYTQLQADNLYSKTPEEFKTRFFTPADTPELNEAKQTQETFLSDFQPTDEDYTDIKKNTEIIFSREKPEIFPGSYGYYETLESRQYDLQQEYLKKADGNLEKAKQNYIADQEAGLQNKKVEEWADENVSSWSDIKNFFSSVSAIPIAVPKEIDPASFELETQEKAAKVINEDLKKQIDIRKEGANKVVDQITALDEQLESLAKISPQNQEAAQSRAKKYNGIVEQRVALAQQYKLLHDDLLQVLPSYDDNQALLDVVKRSYKMVDQPKLFGAAAAEIIGGALDVPEWLSVSMTTTLTDADPRVAKALYRSNPMNYGSGLGVASDALADYGEKVRNSIRKPKDITDLKDLNDWAFWASDLTFNQLPQVGLMVVAPELSLPLMGASSAGGKYRGMMEEIELYNKDYEGWQLLTVPAIVGAAEVISERITVGQLKGVKNIFTSKNGVKKAAQEYIENNILKGKYFKDVFEEGGSEVFAQLSENIADKYLLGKDDVNIWDGVTNAFASGAFMSGVMFKAPVIGAKLMNPFSKTDDLKKINNNTAMLRKISAELQKEDLDGDIKQSLQAYQTSIEKDNLKTLSKLFKGVDKLTDAEKSRLISIDRSLNDKRSEFLKINSDQKLDEQMKNQLLNNIDQELSDLYDEKNNLINAGDVRLETEAIEKGAKNIFEGAVEVIRVKDSADAQSWIDKNKDNWESLKYKKQEDLYGLSSNYGFIVENDNGKKAIVINEGESAGDFQVTTGRHEFLHALLSSTIASRAGADIDLGFALVKELRNQIDKGAILSPDFKARINAYAKNNNVASADALFKLETAKDVVDYIDNFLTSPGGKQSTVQFEEMLTLTSEALATGDIVLNENFLTKLADVIRRFFNDTFNIDIKFDSGKDVLNFIKDYNKAVDKGGQFSGRFKKLAQQGATGKVFGSGVSIKELSKQEIKESKSKAQQEAVKKELDSIARDANGNFDKAKYKPSDPQIAKHLRGMIEVQAQKYVNKGLQLDMNELVQEVSVSLYTKGDINRFDGAINNSLYGWLNISIKFRILDAFKNNASIVTDFGKTSEQDLFKEFSQEESDDLTNQNERYAAEEALSPTLKKQKLLSAIDIKTEVDGTPYVDSITSALEKSISLNIKQYTEEISKNVTVTPFVSAIKKDLGDDFYKVTKKFINAHPGGFEGFLADAKVAIMDNFTTTYLAKHPLFRKGIMKSSGGTMTKDNLGNDLFVPNWVAATQNDKGKWGWWDEKGNALKIDRDNAGARGLTSGPEFIKRNPDINSIISTNEFIDYHFQDGPQRKKKKQNPEDAIAKQISAELGFEILENDLKSNGKISERLKQVSGLYEMTIDETEINNIVKDLDRGNIKLSLKLNAKPKVYEQNLNKSKEIAVNFGFESKEYLKHINSLPEGEQQVINAYWEKRGLGNLEFFQDQKAKNLGIRYEKYILDLFKSLNLPKGDYKVITTKVKGSDATGEGDITIQLKNLTLNFEIKLNIDAQMGSFGIAALQTDGKDIEGTIKDYFGEDSGVADKWLEAYEGHLAARKKYAAKADEKHEEFLKDPIYAAKYKGADQLTRGAISFDQNNLRVPTEVVDALGGLGEGLQKEMSFELGDVDLSFMIDHYKKKNVHYIQIGKLGLFSLNKDFNPLNAPLLSGTGTIRNRVVWGSSSKATRYKGKESEIATLDKGPKAFVFRSFFTATKIEGFDKTTPLYNFDNPNDVRKVLEPISSISDKPSGSTKQSLKANVDQLLERRTGISAQETISAARAANLGKNKGKFKFFVPYNAEDFVGLLYPILGKGKQGNADRQLLEEALVKPYNDAENAISSYKQRLAKDFKALTRNLKENAKGIDEKTIKAIEDSGFSVDQAARVYLWDKLGYTIPNLTPQEKNSLVAKVRQSPALVKYSNGLSEMTQAIGQYPKPTEDWFGDNVKSEMYNFINKEVRAKFLEKWEDNVNVVFSKENLNKLEAKFGAEYRRNLEQTLSRMRTGRSRPLNLGKAEGAALDYINGSVGVIMFLNARSAVLQTISSVNFINWSDNNILEVGKVLANPKLYANTFMEIWNSDFLRQRRSGLEINVEEAEIARAVEKAKGKPKAIYAALIKLGFKPTQLADSFAIAIGGAPFYANRTKTYIKEGYSEAEAKKMAFDDFRALAEEHQQSSRQDRLSNIQTGLFGRLVFAFNNTPFQMTRLTKKAALDLINGRGDWRSNTSKLVYYGAVQNAIFYSLQQAMFAVLFDEEEEEQVTEREERLFNAMLDGFLRGSGLPGAVISSLKNILVKYNEQQEKGYQGDFMEVALAALSIMPPLSSKVQKAYSAYKKEKYFTKTKKGKQQLEEMDAEWYQDPTNIATAQYISSTTNIPIDRIMTKLDHLNGMMDESYAPWQRTALALGWGRWELGMYDRQTQTKEEKSKTRSDAQKEAWRKKKRQQQIQDSINMARMLTNTKTTKINKR